MIDPDEVRRANPARRRYSEGDPHDDLTRMGELLIEAFERDPQYGEGMRLIVLIDDLASDPKRGGAASHGYDDDTEMLMNLYRHARAIFQGHGLDIEIKE